MKQWALSLSAAVLWTGCVGYDIPPRVFSWKPFTLLRGSEQVARDQITNRYLVAKETLSLKGLYSNEVLTLIGQPQQIRPYVKNFSEDWLYTYFKIHPKDRLDADQGQFLVRIYEGKVIDVVRDL